MSSLNLKLRRDLYGSKGLLLAITSIIVVGIIEYVTLHSTYQNLNEAKLRYYRQCRMADFWIDVKKLPLSEIDSVARLPGIAEAAARIQFRATVDIEDVVEPINALVISLPNDRQANLNNVLLRQGDYFTERRDNEVLISEKFARTHNLYPGQTVHLLLNNRRQELIVVGTVIGSEFTYSLGPGAIVPDSKKFGIFYVKQRFAEEVFDFRGAANQIIGRLSTPGGVGVDDVLSRAETLLDPYGVFSTTPLRLQASNQFLSNEIAGLGAIATIVPTIFLSVAALVLNVLMTRLARQQRMIVGTLKALGYSDWQVFEHFMKFGLTIGIVGGVIGCISGYWLSSGITGLYRYFFEFPELVANFYWHTHAQAMSVSLLCAIIGSVYGARGVLKLNPAEAMRPEPPRAGRGIWLESFTAFWSNLSAAWRMTLRSIFRNRFRTATGLFASSMGAGLLVHGFMLTEAQRFLIDFQFRMVVKSDFDLSFESERGESAIDEIRSLPAIDLVEPTLEVACTFVNGHAKRKGAISGLKRNALLTIPRDMTARPIDIPENGLVISRRLAKILSLNLGDYVTVLPIKGERRPMKMLVVRIADGYMGLAAYADLEYLNRLLGESQVVTGVQLITNRQRREEREMHSELKQMPSVQAVQSRHDQIDSLTRTLLENQKVFIVLLVAFSGVIFFGSIVNASLISLAERQREVATFLALGYTHWEVGGMFLRESLLINSIGTLLGLPVGWFLMWLTAWGYENDLIRLPVVTADWIWYITILMSITFALAAHAIVQRTIIKMDYVDVLKVKE